VLELGSPADRGMSFLLLAKCQLAQLSNLGAHTAALPAAALTAALHHVLASLAAAANHLEASGGRDGVGAREGLAEAHYLTSRTLHALATAADSPTQRSALAQQRNAAAAAFRTCRVAAAR